MDGNSHDAFVKELLDLRRSRPVSLPVKAKVAQFAEELLQLMFPHFSGVEYQEINQVEEQFQLLRRNLDTTLAPLRKQLKISVDDIVEQFAGIVPRLYHQLCMDAEAIYQGDPAAESVDEVISAYPGFYAIAIFRIAHEFYKLNVPIFPRILTENAHQRTGIERFFIDHGTGIVIGETTVIGDDVKIYQGVTLGALSVDKTLASSKRHPTIEHNVVLYSNATILGGSTVIGHDSVIGGNVWLTESVPPYSVVYHKSEVRVRSSREEQVALDFVI